MKMLRRFQVSGRAEALTRSLLRAIMAPSLNTASSTISSVGKYLRPSIKLLVLFRYCAPGPE